MTSVFIDCQEGWKQDRKQDGTMGNYCYKLSGPDDKKTWQAAQTECENNDAHLAHIENDDTNNFYEHLVRYKSFGTN